MSIMDLFCTCVYITVLLRYAASFVISVDFLLFIGLWKATKIAFSGAARHPVVNQGMLRFYMMLLDISEGSLHTVFS